MSEYNALPDLASADWEEISDDGIEEIDLGYRPRPLQQLLHTSLKRWNLLVCHRRFGKTVFSIMEMIDRGLRNEFPNPQYAYIAPTYGQAKRVAWEYLKQFCSKIPNAKANEAELRIDIERDMPDGSKGKLRFMLLGAEKPDSLRGIYLNGCVLDEYAQCPPMVWGEVVRPALSDHKGWAIFIGTPKGQNHFCEMRDIFAEEMKNDPEGSYFTRTYRASETGVVDDEELYDARATMTEEEYNQEYECDFSAALVGSYYGKYINELEKTGRIDDFDIDPGFPVCTAWDLGISDTTCIWFYQVVGREIRIIDFIENNGVGLEWYARALQDKGYIYDQFGHAIPHDGAARELGTGKTRQEQLYEYNIVTHIIEKQSIADGIHAARTLLQNPHVYIHKTNCERGLICLRNYQRSYDKRKGMFLDKPLHNWASNGADAFRYMALDLNLPGRGTLRNITPRERMAVSDYDEFA